jgi:hypothetical protein
VEDNSRLQAAAGLRAKPALMFVDVTVPPTCIAVHSVLHTKPQVLPAAPDPDSIFDAPLLLLHLAKFQVALLLHGLCSWRRGASAVGQRRSGLWIWRLLPVGSGIAQGGYAVAGVPHGHSWLGGFTKKAANAEPAGQRQ